MLQGHLCSLSGNGKCQRREEEEASCEVHHFGRWNISQYPVPRSSGGRKGFARERRQQMWDLLVPGSLARGLRHKFAASALVRHRHNR
jgi:hypothetical protein